MAAILFIGDVVGRPGRRALRALLPALREELATDFVIVNGENSAGGFGITPKEAEELFKLGADVITLGNHAYRQREIWPYLEEERRIIRPYNYLPGQPGRGTTVVERDGVTLDVVNLSGEVRRVRAQNGNRAPVARATSTWSRSVSTMRRTNDLAMATPSMLKDTA